MARSAATCLLALRRGETVDGAFGSALAHAGDAGCTRLLVTVSRAGQDPNLAVTLCFEPGPDAGFSPGLHLVPETHILLIGAGARIFAYDLRAPRRVWEGVANTGFWGWERHGNTIVMAAELELAAWDFRASKLWSTFVEPPWSYEVRNGRILLEVMGRTTSFDLVAGSPTP